MKMYFIKNEAGELVLVKDPEVGKTYLDGDGNDIVCEAPADVPITQAPAIKTDGEDAVKELTGLIREMATNVNKLNDTVGQQEEAIAAYKQAAVKGFPIPAQADTFGASPDEVEDMFKEYNLAEQGRRLCDKFVHPHNEMTEEKRMILAKYFLTFLKAGVFQDRQAMDAFHANYGRPQIQGNGKTALGDSGNVFPVPDIVDSEILTFARESSLALQYARVWPMTSEKQSFPSETGASSVAWGNTTSESDPTVTEVELDAYELSAYTSSRNTTLSDSRSDIVSWLTEMMAEAAGLELDNVMFNGDGTSTYAGCSGILTAAAGYSTVLAGGSTAFSNIGATALSSMIGDLDGMKKQGARFFMNGSVLHFVRSLTDDNGKPIFIETIGAPLSGTIWGYPYSEAIKCPSTTGANTAFVAFGNLRYFAIGRRLDATALHVDPFGLWTTNRTRFKLYQRWGLTIGLANGFSRLLTAAQ